MPGQDSSLAEASQEQLRRFGANDVPIICPALRCAHFAPFLTGSLVQTILPSWPRHLEIIVLILSNNRERCAERHWGDTCRDPSFGPASGTNLTAFLKEATFNDTFHT